jgi:hypothetical protein
MPSNPSPEEREAREECRALICTTHDRAIAEHALDAYARAVYDRGVRDAMAVVPMRGENACGCIAVRVTEPVIRYVQVCGEHFRKLEAMRTVGPDSPAVFRTLTPTESPNE